MIIILTNSILLLLHTEPIYGLFSVVSSILSLVLFYLTLKARIGLEEKLLLKKIIDKNPAYFEQVPKFLFTKESLLNYIKTPFFTNK
ncbi:MAG: hypothetical protein A4E53_01479 [Pelotomaculum sp. PtaB.Bin104]|nr:MAG: hypothetical protein A4E53_01479 [Pelotomaculum sp. PtaB.Bin104]